MQLHSVIEVVLVSKHVTEDTLVGRLWQKLQLSLNSVVEVIVVRRLL